MGSGPRFDQMDPSVLDRANHTGTQLHTTISDFDTGVQTNRLDQMAAPTAAVDLNGQQINSLAAPSVGTDAARLQDVQSLSWKTAADLATDAALPAVTYANGASGVGRTLTADAVGVLTVDGETVQLGETIIVKDQAAGLQNGTYECTTEGTAGVAFVLTGKTDGDTSAEVDSETRTAKRGSVNADTTWTQTADSPTMGTTPLAYAEVGGAAPVDSVNGQTGVAVLDQDDVGALENTYTARGDIPVAGVAAAESVLAVGTLNQAIVSDGTDPGWAAIVNSVNSQTGAAVLDQDDVGALENTYTARGDLPVAGVAAAESVLPIGAPGQVLQVNAGGTDPEWGEVPKDMVRDWNTTLAAAGPGVSTGHALSADPIGGFYPDTWLNGLHCGDVGLAGSEIYWADPGTPGTPKADGTLVTGDIAVVGTAFPGGASLVTDVLSSSYYKATV